MPNDPQIGLIWAALLGFIDQESQLKNELKRVAQAWASNKEIILQLIQSLFQWNKRTQTQDRALFKIESAIGLMIEILQFHLEEHPPSKAQDRAELYHLKGSLLSLCELEAEDEALKAFEIALSLNSDLPFAWYDLARLHALRGRWEKSDLALQCALDTGLDAPQVEWMRLLIATALGSTHQQQAHQALSSLNHDVECAILSPQGRWSFLEMNPVLVSISSHMLDPYGQRDATQEWKTEVVWVHPLNPCYGRIMHPLIHSLPADFDDLIIWDPQPLEFQEINTIPSSSNAPVPAVSQSVSKSNHQEQEKDDAPIFKAIQVLQKGKAHVRPFPLPPLSSENRAKLNQSLPTGVFYHQSEYIQDPHGKLCWPRDTSSNQTDGMNYTANQIFHLFQSSLEDIL